MPAPPQTHRSPEPHPCPPHRLSAPTQLTRSPAPRELTDTLIAAKPLRDRLLGVLGASAALAD
ncbi:hypothetical protein ACFV2Z_39145, partial [Streptomyces sp. NPDC059688]|uniref:hypothetical protein n=1 Tax=Streptomyces sp. NPDC059688 TaxID=3346906 RepID=UPI0036CCC0F7